jgi:putative ABC transport system ATP-binding protein
MKLKAENISMEYKDGEKTKKIIDGVDLCFEKNGINVLVGPSGSGKSTLLYMLAALRRPTGGKLVFNGKNIENDRLAERTRAEDFGFIFQRHFLIPYLTVMENVRLGSEDKADDKEIMSLLERLSC